MSSDVIEPEPPEPIYAEEQQGPSDKYIPDKEEEPDFDEEYGSSFGDLEQQEQSPEVPEEPKKQDLEKLGILKPNITESVDATIDKWRKLLNAKNPPPVLMKYKCLIDGGLIDELMETEGIIFDHPSTFYYILFYPKLKKSEKFLLEIREETVIIRDAKKVSGTPDWDIKVEFSKPEVLKLLFIENKKSKKHEELFEKLRKKGHIKINQKDQKYAEAAYNEYHLKCTEAMYKFHTG